MDAESMKLVIELADKLTSMAFMLWMISYLIKKLAVFEGLLLSDWEEDKKSDRDRNLKASLSKEITQSGL